MNEEKIKDEIKRYNNSQFQNFDSNIIIRKRILDTALNIIEMSKKVEYLSNEFFRKYYYLDDDISELFIDNNNLNDIKIFLKGKILESEVCNQLQISNITDYDVNQLKQYVDYYEEQNNVNLDDMKTCIEFYSQIEDIYSILEDEKELIYSELINRILGYKLDTLEYEQIVINLKEEKDKILNLIKTKFFEKVLDEFTFTCFTDLIIYFFNIIDLY